MAVDGAVVAISGRTRAGKTTLAAGLERELGWQTASFSSWIRAEARERGLAEERRPLQDLGARLIEELGWDEFCLAMLRHARVGPADAPFAVEGIRHVGTLDGLRDVLAPVEVVLVHLNVSDEERNRRLAAEGVDVETGAAWERHWTEQEVLNALPTAADLVIDGDQPKRDVLATVVNWLDESRRA